MRSFRQTILDALLTAGDIRRWDVLEPLLAARFKTCKDKGFDAVEPDNVDGYSNGSGFPLTATDQHGFQRVVNGTVDIGAVEYQPPATRTRVSASGAVSFGKPLTLTALVNAQVPGNPVTGPVTFSLDGQYAYPSTGEVVDTKTKAIVAALKDETGREVHSEKMVEIVFKDGMPVRTGDQFGVGRVAPPAKGTNR